MTCIIAIQCLPNISDGILIAGWIVSVSAIKIPFYGQLLRTIAGITMSKMLQWKQTESSLNTEMLERALRRYTDQKLQKVELGKKTSWDSM